MFNFFKKNKNSVDINSISIPTFGWNKVKESSDQIAWVNPEQSALISLYFFNIPPDLPTIKNIDFLRDFYRNSVASSGGGIIEVTIFNLHDIPSSKTIFKFPQEEHGMNYLASITIPFENCSFVIKVQTAEVEITGIRDSFILEKLLNNGEVTFANENIQNWFEDPYNPSFRKGILMNKSEQEKYDKEFPEHPLTIARKLIQSAIDQSVFSSEIYALSSFKK